MIRRAAAVALALTLQPALLYAQDTVLTVTVPSADVYKGPSTVTPVIGHVSRGTVLPVARNLGSWAKVAWPDAPDGVGYLHVTMGRLGPPNGAVTPSVTKSSASASARPSSPSGPAPVPMATTTITPRPRTSSGERVVVRGEQGATISHLLGVGGLVSSPNSFGATARAWRNNRVGLQLGVTRDVMTSKVTSGRVTAMQFESGVVYALIDHVSDYIWIRPYVGSSLSLRRQTLTVLSPDPAAHESSNGIGFRAFGGGELTFATVTRFGLSAEVGYRRFPSPFVGFEADRLSVSIAGHWYIK
jgi:hypothetical protein